MSCDSLMPFNCCEFTVAYLRWLSFRTASTALTPLGDVPVPLNRRIGGESFDVGGAQAVRASAAMHEMSWMLRLGELICIHSDIIWFGIVGKADCSDCLLF